jgi:hypothetical protein
VYLVILLAAGAILGGVVVVAMGRGGEMALFDRDLPVKITRLQTPGEVATLQLPFGLIGYQARATGEALVAVANLLARRDAEIAALRGELWRAGGSDQAPPVEDAGDPGEEAPVARDLDHDEAGWNDGASWEDEDAREDRAGEHEQTGQSDGASQTAPARRIRPTGHE